jgi:MFS transporter, AAHS family, 4-hydroxybenzoate transporter
MPAQIDVSDWINRQAISRLQVTVLILCAMCALLEGLDTQNIGFVAPVIIREWALPPHSFTPAFMSGLLGLLVGCLLVAPLADFVGRKAILLGSVSAFAVFSLLSATATSLTVLSVLRFLTGVGIGGGMANAIAMTSEYFPERRRAAMTVIMFLGFSLGASLGGFIAAGLIPILGWRSVFVACGILPLLLAVLLALGLPESIRHLVAHQVDPERIKAILQQINPNARFAEDISFVIAEERKRGFPIRHLFTQGRALGTCLIWVVFFMSLLDIYLVASWLPVVLHDAGLAVSTSAIVTAMLHVSGVAVCLLIAPAIDRIGCLVVMLPAYFVAALGIAALGSVGTSVALLVLAASAAGIGIVCGQNTANAFAAAFYPTYIRATGVGWALGIGRIGAVVGPGIGGIMLALEWSRQTIFLVSAIPELIVVAAILCLMRLEGSKAQQQCLPAASSLSP